MAQSRTPHDPAPTVATADEVAAWMAAEFNAKGKLSQNRAARAIRNRFGREHLYTNPNRSEGISKAVLEAFKKLTPNAVWNRSDQTWYRAKPGEMRRIRK